MPGIARTLVNKFLSQTKIGLPVYLFEQEPPASLSVPGVPTTFVLAADGKIVFMHSGGIGMTTEPRRISSILLRRF
jgi:hypothetical protein